MSFALAGGTLTAGTAFALDLKNGKLKSLHTFGEDGDGGNPNAGLTKVGDASYGSTVDGGAAGFGTIYKLDPKSGAESIVHSFNESDGEVPFSELVAVGKHIYGTTERGGSAGNGAVFEITA